MRRLPLTVRQETFTPSVVLSRRLEPRYAAQGWRPTTSCMMSRMAQSGSTSQRDRLDGDANHQERRYDLGQPYIESAMPACDLALVCQLVNYNYETLRSRCRLASRAVTVPMVSVLLSSHTSRGRSAHCRKGLAWSGLTQYTMLLPADCASGPDGHD
jgi:hypothetical protein